MFASGNATVNVSNLDAAIRFYTQQLGLRLTNRIGDRWATAEMGPSYWTTEAVMAGLTLGLRPASSHDAAPGTQGGVGFGLETYRPCEEVIAEFTKRGIQVASEIIRFEAGNTFAFEAFDGFPSYVHEFPPEMIDEADRERHSTSGAANALLSGGHAIVYVSNMDAAIRFYADTLGLKLTNRFEDHFATVEAGRTLVIGLHPITPRSPQPGGKGTVTLSLVVDEPINAVLSRLAQRGVRMPAAPNQSGKGGTGQAGAGRSVDIEDLDGNVITLWEAQAFSGDGELAAPEMAARS